MNSAAVAAAISAVGLALSVLASAFIAGTRWGSVNQRLDQLAERERDHVTRDDLANVREQLAEIRGMFRLTLKDQDSSQ